MDKNPIEIVCKLISDESRITDEERDAVVDILYHSDDDYLAHYGVKGMRKGIRRWTNEDGTLTDAGKEHYGIGLDTGNKMNKKASRVYIDAKKAYAEGDYYSGIHSRNFEKYTNKAFETGKEKYEKKADKEYSLVEKALNSRKAAENLLKQIESSEHFGNIDTRDKEFSFYSTRGRQILDNLPIIAITPWVSFYFHSGNVRRDKVAMITEENDDGTYTHKAKRLSR